jgi:hypothetical protein
MKKYASASWEDRKSAVEEMGRLGESAAVGTLVSGLATRIQRCVLLPNALFRQSARGPSATRSARRRRRRVTSL